MLTRAPNCLGFRASGTAHAQFEPKSFLAAGGRFLDQRCSFVRIGLVLEAEDRRVFSTYHLCRHEAHVDSGLAGRLGDGMAKTGLVVSFNQQDRDGRRPMPAARAAAFGFLPETG